MMILRTIWTRSLAGLAMLLLLTPILSTVAVAAGAPASERVIEPFSLEQQLDKLVVTWQIEGNYTTHAAEQRLAALPVVRFQGYELPLQLFTIYLQDPALSATITLNGLEGSVWDAAVVPAPPLTPPVSGLPDGSAMNASETVALPSTPIFVVRQGWVHDQLVAVVALSPLYQVNEIVYLATHLRAEMPLATRDPVSRPGGQQSSEQTVGVAAMHATDDNLLPTNPLAARQGHKVIVQTAGIQQMTGSRLAAAGLDLNTTDPAKLQLWHRGQQIPMQIESPVNGKIAPTSVVSFYAPQVGDRWNTNAVYWLVVGATDGRRISTRSVAPGNAATRNTALEAGEWIDNQLYQSLLPGPDGDYWFHREMIFVPTTPPTMTIPIDAALPRATGTATYSLTLSTRAAGPYEFALQVGQTTQTWDWHSAPDQILIPNWVHAFQAQSPATTVQLALTQGDTAYGLLIDQMSWQQPALLIFNERGASFRGLPGEWFYQWQQAPVDPTSSGYRLYDVTDPETPVLLTGASAAGFQDGPQPHAYLLTGPGTLYEPSIATHEPVHFAVKNGADAIYITPADFNTALSPLVAHRRQQGYQVAVVDVQDIYDAWNYGYSSAEAIRTFLRFSHAHWQPAPSAAILVGDGTWDPHNYQQRAHHTNWIPPYTAYVDPWIGEAACDNCFGQLDGNDPLISDALAGRFFATELWMGRLPVKSAEELTALVQKLIRYDTSQSAAGTNNRHLFLADNFINSVDSDGVPRYDKAGDFALASDQTAALVGGAGQVQRIYYDPYSVHSDPSGQESWRIGSAQAARNATLAALNDGVAVVTYNGHANNWQWGYLESDPSVPGLLSLYDPDAFQNRDQLYIALSMSCLTGQFHKPTDSGTVLDERQLLSPTGGAIAVWAPAGLSVVQAHDRLQQGFYKRWVQGGTVPLGELLDAGYRELREGSICCQDTLQTFLLLGDPLTKVTIGADERIFLPIISR